MFALLVQDGVIDLDRPLTLTEIADDQTLAPPLTRSKPRWEPGKGYGYHAFVIGALTGEVVRRAAMNPTPAEARSLAADPADPASLLGIAFNLGSENKDFTLAITNTRAVRANGPASVGGVGSVRRRFAFPGGTAPENARLIQALVDAAAKTQ